MKLFDLISMTFRNLLRRKARTLLTMTGVVVGTCAIVVMISLGLAMTQAMEESLAQMGDLTQITIQNYGSSQDLKLNDEVVSKVQKLEGVVAVTPMASASNLNMMAYAGRNDRYQMYLYNVMGVYPEALPYFGYQVQEGEMLTSSPAPKKTAYMMFGGESAYEFEDSKRSWRNNRVYATPDENGKMPDPFVDPMNDKITLRLQAREFDENGKPKYPEVTRDVHVTGVLVSDNSVGWETSYYCFMDIRELRELEKEYKRVNKIRDDKNSDNNNGLENYQQVKVKVSDIDLVSRVDQAIKEMGFETYSLDSVREPMQKQMQQQQLFLGSLAAISLLVAAIGITNTMIMSIYERTREIGVMRGAGLSGRQYPRCLFDGSGLDWLWRRSGRSGHQPADFQAAQLSFDERRHGCRWRRNAVRYDGRHGWNGFGFAAFHHSGLADCRGDCVCHCDWADFRLLSC